MDPDFTGENSLDLKTQSALLLIERTIEDELAELKGSVNSQDYLKVISKHWQKAVESIYAIAQVCALADKNLGMFKADFIDQLPFSASTFSKLASIGKDRRFQNPAFLNSLPPSWSVMYEISKLSVGELEEAKEKGIIQPKLTRLELKQWLSGSSNDYAGLVYFAGIYVPANFKHEEDLLKYINGMNDLEGVRLHTPVSDKLREEEIKEISAKWKKAYAEARRMVRNFKKQVRKQKKKWPYAPEEMKITSKTDLNEILGMMSDIGHEVEFEEILKKLELIDLSRDDEATIADRKYRRDQGL